MNHLDTVNDALRQMGNQLPVEFSKAFEELDKKYRAAFVEMDSGLENVANHLLAAVETLVQAVSVHNNINGQS